MFFTAARCTNFYCFRSYISLFLFISSSQWKIGTIPFSIFYLKLFKYYKYNITIIIFILKLSSGISISILIIDDRVTKNPKLPKTQTQERIEINDGQPEHRYVKQASLQDMAPQ